MTAFHTHVSKCTGPSLATQWHVRFPCYQLRLARMAQHCRTEEFAKGLDRLTACGLTPETDEGRALAWAMS